jgi:hypothetical protein
LGGVPVNSTISWCRWSKNTRGRDTYSDKGPAQQTHSRGRERIKRKGEREEERRREKGERREEEMRGSAEQPTAEEDEQLDYTGVISASPPPILPLPFPPHLSSMRSMVETR